MKYSLRGSVENEPRARNIITQTIKVIILVFCFTTSTDFMTSAWKITAATRLIFLLRKLLSETENIVLTSTNKKLRLYDEKQLGP